MTTKDITYTVVDEELKNIYTIDNKNALRVRAEIYKNEKLKIFLNISKKQKAEDL